MAGGVGTRFWPFSRNNFPKQFHDVLGTGQSLLQQTVSRFEGICPIENIYIVTSADYYELVKKQIPVLSDHQILLEPSRRNTAPCLAYACYKIASKDPKANVIVAPSDHIMLKEDVFRERLSEALQKSAEGNNLVTLGIKPSRADTGYGYIQFEKSESVSKKVKQFTEKPDLEIAEQFVESGEYVWNAGIFIGTTQSFCKAFELFLPEIATKFEAGNNVYYSENEVNFIEKTYSECQSISIDVGIMEKADNVFVILSDFGWSDLGTWKSLYDVAEKDNSRNTVEGNVMIYDTQNCIIKTPSDKLVVVQGLDGYIVAENEGVLMICKIDEEQRVKNFVADAQKLGSQYV